MDKYANPWTRPAPASVLKHTDTKKYNQNLDKDACARRKRFIAIELKKIAEMED